MSSYVCEPKNLLRRLANKDSGKSRIVPLYQCNRSELCGDTDCPHHQPHEEVEQICGGDYTPCPEIMAKIRCVLIAKKTVSAPAAIQHICIYSASCTYDKCVHRQPHMPGSCGDANHRNPCSFMRKMVYCLPIPSSVPFRIKSPPEWQNYKTKKGFTYVAED